MRVVVLGAEGQLGRELARTLPSAMTLLGRRDLDVRDAAAVRARLATLRPDVVVNAAADNRVDGAERDPAAAFAVNAAGAEHVAVAAAAVRALVVHLSTDYVFRGDRPASGPPYQEDDAPDPISAYGRSKRAGEERVLEATPRAVIVRTAGLYAAGGSGSKGGSFVDRVLAQARAGEPLRVVDDQLTSPTWARDVAATITAALARWVADEATRGIYHVTNAGACSWFDFARTVLALAGVHVPVQAIASAALGAVAPRPAYSVLANTRLGALGLAPLRSWRDALAAYLSER